MRDNIADRVQAWDRALGAVRGYFRAEGLCEVSPPVRLDAVAIEPYIEPVRAEGGLLATSPELPMKRLLAAGSPSVFAVAPVHRRAERGRLHAEGFHLIEWYRVAADDRAVRKDVERLIATVLGVFERQTPEAWEVHGFLPLLADTAGVVLRGDESAEALERVLPRQLRTPVPPTMPQDAHDLFAWSALLTLWSDTALDAWLAGRRGGVHIVDYPAPLAALADLGPPRVGGGGEVAHRFESYLGGVELANGYRELADAHVQRGRFSAVQSLRRGHGQDELPWPEAFLDTLAHPGLPACGGAALGFERLLMLAVGADSLAQVLPWADIENPDAD